MSIKSGLREAVAYIEEFGLKYEVLSQNYHFKLRVIAPDGREDTITVAVSASDHRASKNKRSQLKRFANGGTIRGAR